MKNKNWSSYLRIGKNGFNSSNEDDDDNGNADHNQVAAANNGMHIVVLRVRDFELPDQLPVKLQPYAPLFFFNSETNLTSGFPLSSATLSAVASARTTSVNNDGHLVF